MKALSAEPALQRPLPSAPGDAASTRGGRARHFARSYWVDIAWVAFIGLNLIAMRVLTAWQTVPFLIIWVSLTTIYGFRLWRLGSTLLTVAVVTLSTGALIGWQVLRGQQDGDYLAEVPLVAVMFVVMVWHSRRRLAAMEEMKRVSEHNLPGVFVRTHFRTTCWVSSASSCRTSPMNWARPSPSLLATPSSSPTLPPIRRSPRMRRWPSMNCSGCAGWPTG